MKQLDATPQTETAVDVATVAQSESPSLAVGIELARRLKSAGNARGAADALSFVPKLRGFRTDEWAVARDAAHTLAAGGRPAAAVEIYHTLLDSSQTPRELLLAWLPEAAAAASEAGNFAEEERWKRAFAELENRRAVKKK
jgi:hypothetical protein